MLRSKSVMSSAWLHNWSWSSACDLYDPHTLRHLLAKPNGPPFDASITRPSGGTGLLSRCWVTGMSNSHATSGAWPTLSRLPLPMLTDCPQGDNVSTPIDHTEHSSHPMQKTLSRNCSWYRDSFFTITSPMGNMRQRLHTGTSFAASLHCDAAHQSICRRGAEAVLQPGTFEHAYENDIT